MKKLNKIKAAHLKKKMKETNKSQRWKNKLSLLFKKISDSWNKSDQIFQEIEQRKQEAILNKTNLEAHTKYFKNEKGYYESN